MKELKTAFDLFDRDQSGAISTEEWKVVLVNLMPKITNEQMMTFIARFDLGKLHKAIPFYKESSL